MGRLEKARAAKRKSKKRFQIVIVITGILLVLILAGLYNENIFNGRSTEAEADLIDLEKSAAFIDIFGLTYVHIYLNANEADLEVTVIGEPLEYSAEESKWDLVLTGYSAGDELTVQVVAADDEQKQVEVLIIEDL